MKKSLLISLALAPLLGSAQDISFNITVKLSKLKNDCKAYLVYRKDDKEVTDSVAGKDGVWVFTGTVSEPVKAYLLLDNTGAGIWLPGWADLDLTVVYLEKGRIQITGTDNVKEATLTGGPINKEYALYKAEVLTPGQKIIDGLKKTFLGIPDEKKKEPGFMDSLMQFADQALENRSALKYEYVKQHPASYVSLDALIELTNEYDGFKKTPPLFISLAAPLKASKRGQALGKSLLDELRTIAIGTQAPDFTQNDVNDKPVKLSDFKGKYVLLEFWASWCSPCREENPNVVKAYNKFKDKNFTVLGVSLDRPGKKDAWQAAIQQDGLQWTQVSDLQFWKNAVAKQYLVNSIPQNFLIDPNGKIIDKNLRGEELEKKLEELLAGK